MKEKLLQNILDSHEAYEASVPEQHGPITIEQADTCSRKAEALCWHWTNLKWHLQREQKQTNHKEP